MAPLRPDVTGINVMGAGAASNTWLALLADIWGTSVRRRSITSQVNTVGAAVTRLFGRGRADFSIPTLSVVEAELAPGHTGPAYRVHLERFVDAYRALRPWFAGRESGKR
jgi:xylulokinase